MTPKLSISSFIFLVAATGAHVTDDASVLATGVDAELLSKINLNKDAFGTWKEEFQMSYTSAKDEVEKMLVWIENHEFIENHNNQDPPSSFRLGHNHFSDLTNDEFKELNFLGEYGPDTSGYDFSFEKEATTTSFSRKLLEDLPESVNWVTKGAVTPAKNQGQCGACWAFSAVGAIEGAKFIASGELVSLSEQHLIDCDSTDKGCNGGNMFNAFAFDEIEGGLCNETAYPYQGHLFTQTCLDKTCEEVEGTKVKTFEGIPEGDFLALRTSVSQQPTCIALHASDLTFQLYHSGVYSNSSCDTHVNHGVLAVGYGKDETSGLDYWLVKNSWGPMWGDSGFFKINSAYTPGTTGMCGILSTLSAKPILE